MAVTAKQWNSLNILEKLELARKELNFTKDAELARLLGITPRAIRYWKTGEKLPSKKVLDKLKVYCVNSTYENLKDEAFFALSSISADASYRLMLNAITCGDPMMLAMSTHCIAIKLSALIQAADSEKTIISSISSVYGDVSSTVVKITHAGDVAESDYAYVQITPPKLKNQGFIMHVKTISNNQNIVSQVSYVVSDRALAAATRLIFKFLNKSI